MFRVYTFLSLLFAVSMQSYADDINVCRSVASRIAAGLPAQLNRYVRSDSVACLKVSGDRVVMVAHYTADGLTWDSKGWQTFQQDTIKDVCRDQEQRELFRYVSGLRQEWHYKSGAEIGSVTVWRKDCEK